MFSANTAEPTNTDIPVSQKKTPKPQNSSNYYTNQQPNIYSSNEVTLLNLEKILDKERVHNKTESWNKLDKTVKLQKLHSFSERYAVEHHLPAQNVKLLKAFFKDCLENNKLSKTKELVYDKETNEISSIPALHFNTTVHKYTLKIVDTKRVSTMKSLTLPKRQQIVINESLFETTT